MNNEIRVSKSEIPIDEINLEGTVSQIFDICHSFHFIKCRKYCLKKLTKSSRFLT